MGKFKENPAIADCGFEERDPGTRGNGDSGKLQIVDCGFLIQDFESKHKVVPYSLPAIGGQAPYYQMHTA